jgi:hypothetical protein
MAPPRSYAPRRPSSKRGPFASYAIRGHKVGRWGRSGVGDGRALGAVGRWDPDSSDPGTAMLSNGINTKGGLERKGLAPPGASR